jgi:hypothetical protein
MLELEQHQIRRGKFEQRVTDKQRLDLFRGTSGCSGNAAAQLLPTGVNSLMEYFQFAFGKSSELNRRQRLIFHAKSVHR